jgi:hypothetical protein
VGSHQHHHLFPVFSSLQATLAFPGVLSAHGLQAPWNLSEAGAGERWTGLPPAAATLGSLCVLQTNQLLAALPSGHPTSKLMCSLLAT